MFMFSSYVNETLVRCRKHYIFIYKPEKSRDTTDFDKAFAFDKRKKIFNADAKTCCRYNEVVASFLKVISLIRVNILEML